jgi:ribA/ribD-fused uncharacterized protein
MNLLDGVKNISKMVKQYNDLELNQQIIDLTQQALDLVNENARLTAENEELRKKLCDPKYNGKHFVEAAYYDRIWGIGYNENDALDNEDNWGRNELGKILDEVRRRLMLKSAGVYRDIQE